MQSIIHVGFITCLENFSTKEADRFPSSLSAEEVYSFLTSQLLMDFKKFLVCKHIKHIGW